MSPTTPLSRRRLRRWMRMSVPALAAALLAAGGCAPQPAAVPDSRPALLYPCELRTMNLPAELHVMEPVLGLESSGIPKLEVPVDNNSVLKADIRYLVEWYDGQGMSLPSTMSHWIRVIIPTRQSYRIFAIAPSPQAYRARITIINASAPNSEPSSQPGG